MAEVEQQQKRDLETPFSSHQVMTTDTAAALAEEKEKEAELFRSLLKSVATNNISTLQQGLAKQATYWSGVAWVAQALEQRLSGVPAGAIDLGLVTEKLASFVSVPDAGVLKDGDGAHRHSISLQDNPPSAGPLVETLRGLPSFGADMGTSPLPPTKHDGRN